MDRLVAAIPVEADRRGGDEGAGWSIEAGERLGEKTGRVEAAVIDLALHRSGPAPGRDASPREVYHGVRALEIEGIDEPRVRIPARFLAAVSRLTPYKRRDSMASTGQERPEVPPDEAGGAADRHMQTRLTRVRQVPAQIVGCASVAKAERAAELAPHFGACQQFTQLAAGKTVVDLVFQD